MLRKVFLEKSGTSKCSLQALFTMFSEKQEFCWCMMIQLCRQPCKAQIVDIGKEISSGFVGMPIVTLLPWRQGFRHPTKNTSAWVGSPKSIVTLVWLLHALELVYDRGPKISRGLQELGALETVHSTNNHLIWSCEPWGRKSHLHVYSEVTCGGLATMKTNKIGRRLCTYM